MRKIFQLLVVCSLMTVFSSRAPGELNQLGNNYFVAGIPSEQFQSSDPPQGRARQHQLNWCWAACVQMVLNYHGLYVTQEEVVQRVFGAQIDMPGQPVHVLMALQGWAPDASGRFSTIHASTIIAQGSDIVRDLAYRWPLIVGLKGYPVGHAYVLTAVYYNVGTWNQPIFTKVILRDPWPGSPSRQEMNWSEFIQRVTFAARVYVVRH